MILSLGERATDKLFAGTGDTVLDGGPGANHFDCPLSLLGLAVAVVLDYNPDNGDTIAGQSKIVNTVGGGGGGNYRKSIYQVRFTKTQIRIFLVHPRIRFFFLSPGG